MQAETIFILLFVIATAVAIGVRWLRIPYTAALVVAGLVLGTLHVLNPPHLTKELLFSIFLPGLLFEAAFHVEFGEFVHNRKAIVSLAVPGVIVSMLLTALILQPVVNTLDLVHDFTWAHALVFGALIAATDPIAVVSIFKRLGAPPRLAVLMEGESLFNDGTSIVFFTLVLSLAVGQAVSLGSLVVNFFEIVGAGILVGTTIGLLVSKVIERVDEPMIEITLTTIAAYGSFVVAEHLHFSGVIATVVAGMLCGNYGARAGMSPSTRIAVETFWEYIAFALNSVVFLLIGFEVRVASLAASWAPILVAFCAVILGRAVVVGSVTAALRWTRERIPASWAVLLGWGGLRGGLSMVLVLSLAPDFPHRELLVTMTFGVVILSILLQGTTMTVLLRRLGLARTAEDRLKYELARSRLQSATAALRELDHMAQEHFANDEVLQELRKDYQEVVGGSREELRSLHLERQDLRKEELTRARRHLLLVEKNHLLEAQREGLLGREAFEKLLGDADARLLRLESGGTEEPG